MATPLDKKLTRELKLIFKNRPVVLTLIPGDPVTMAVEAIEFRLKGTRQDSLRITTDEAFRYAMRKAMTGGRG